MKTRPMVLACASGASHHSIFWLVRRASPVMQKGVHSSHAFKLACAAAVYQWQCSTLPCSMCSSTSHVKDLGNPGPPQHTQSTIYQTSPLSFDISANSWPKGVHSSDWQCCMPGERVDIMTGSGGKVLSAFVEEVSPMRTHLRDEHWRPYVIPNKVTLAVTSCKTAHCIGGVCCPALPKKLCKQHQCCQLPSSNDIKECYQLASL